MEELKKVYLITAGEYSDYGVVAACSTMERAEAMCEALNRQNGVYGDEAQIEEYPLDQIPVEDLDIPVWCVTYDMLFDTTSVRKRDRGSTLNINRLHPYELFDYTGKPYRGGSSYAVMVLAETEEEAIKKASDYLAKYRAEKEGL